jgi:hypothetical protein
MSIKHPARAKKKAKRIKWRFETEDALTFRKDKEKRIEKKGAIKNKTQKATKDKN